MIFPESLAAGAEGAFVCAEDKNAMTEIPNTAEIFRGLKMISVLNELLGRTKRPMNH
jgi:hypothetical protein